MNKCRCCEKEALNGYEYCEDHVGQALKEEQEREKADAEFFRNYDNLYGP